MHGPDRRIGSHRLLQLLLRPLDRLDRRAGRVANPLAGLVDDDLAASAVVPDGLDGERLCLSGRQRDVDILIGIAVGQVERDLRIAFAERKALVERVGIDRIADFRKPAMHGLQRREIDQLLIVVIAELDPAGQLVGIEHRLVDGDIRKHRLVFFLIARFLRKGGQ